MFAFGLFFTLVGLAIAWLEDRGHLAPWVMWVARPLVYLGVFLMTVSTFIALWWVMP